MDVDAAIHEPPEGEWIYVSTPCAHLNGTAKALSEQIAVTIHDLGWTVLC